MKYPALDVRAADPDLVLAVVDDFAPTAVEDLADGVSIYFTTPERRDEARVAVGLALPRATVSARDVDDGDWARRSQQNLTPITVGRITVTPPWFSHTAAGVQPSVSPSPSAPPASRALTITILPSMGFGTGHHATTRLCLAALQTLDLRGSHVLDVGTGSGVLAIAAAALGAVETLGIDFDADAIANARENLALNPTIAGVRFEVVDVREAPLAMAALVVANLTGAVLVHNAALLRKAVAPGGTLVVSGLLAHERDDVVSTFSGATVKWSAEEAGWVALAFNF
ncbi:MAG TPA: 50S ribosomal protein L11 methyltransferase [Vicinamibacterales bacterium]|nr:50S ribosomal protein L11 methyltransferase [Vicinamibacterales bacterium]